MTHNEQPANEHLRSGIARRAVQVALLIAFQTATLFISSGRLDWGWAWVYLGLYLVGVLVNAFVMLRYSPETIAERAKAGENTKGWDKVVGGLFAVMYFVVMLPLAGLDVRFGWTEPIAPAFHFAGAVTFALGYALFSWAMVSNAYFATFVRIQEDRGHAVCTIGPYRFVRHPGYLGAIVQSLVIPLMLGSLWAFIPGVLAALLMGIRTALEDRTLYEGLAGYVEYTQGVRYRLLPGVW